MTRESIGELVKWVRTELAGKSLKDFWGEFTSPLQKSDEGPPQKISASYGSQIEKDKRVVSDMIAKMIAERYAREYAEHEGLPDLEAGREKLLRRLRIACARYRDPYTVEAIEREIRDEMGDQGSLPGEVLPSRVVNIVEAEAAKANIDKEEIARRVGMSTDRLKGILDMTQPATRDDVAAIGRALGIDQTRLMVSAGYVPESVKNVDTLISAVADLDPKQIDMLVMIASQMR